MKNAFRNCRWGVGILGVGVLLTLASGPAAGQAPLGNDAFSFQIYYVNPGFYPIVQAYLRTFDQNMDPIPSLNIMNMGIQVDGRNIDPATAFDLQTRRGMYGIETLQNRDEAFKTVFVWDCSGSMAGQPFEDAKSAIVKFIQIKRPADQVAIIAIRDTTNGYQLVSGFEKDPTLLYTRMDDVKCDGQKTRLYDSIVGALELCASSSQGAINNTGAEYSILCCIVALSDGHDEGSAISKDALVTKLGSLKPPVPIYSLAYSSKMEQEFFVNMEALSKATFGRYWTVAESQSFSPMLEKIHQINRSDYVVTFHSTVPVDGRDHNFGIGIQWPSNSGRFLFRQGQFIAMESPAILMGGKAKEIRERLMTAYPIPGQAAAVPPVPQAVIPGSASVEQNPIPTNGQAAAPDSPNPIPAAGLAAASDSSNSTSPTGEVTSSDTPETTPPADEPASAESTSSLMSPDNLKLAAVGAGILVLVLGIVVWVRVSSSARRKLAVRPGTGTTGSSTASRIP